MSKEPHKHTERTTSPKWYQKKDKLTDSHVPEESGMESEHTTRDPSENQTIPEPVSEYTTNLAQELQTLKNEFEELRKKSTDYFDGWQRERADFANYKKRIERDQAQSIQNITGEVLKKYLVVLDDLERAMKTRPTEGEGASWADGIGLIIRKLQSVLENEGVIRIPAENESFDPSRHEAITHEDSPAHQSGQVIEVLQQGYTISDRVLRPALVRVAR